MLLPVSQEARAAGAGAGASASSSSASSSSSSARRSGSRGARSLAPATAAVFRSCSSLPEYLSRVGDYRQMDLDATFYQMVTLCTQPSKVYKSAYYRKQTKNRWARDDPAFAVIQLLFLLVATVAWAVTFRVSSAAAFLSLVFHAVVVEWLGFGVLCATLCWWTANRYLRLRANQGIGDTFFVEQRVEWQFAFDIHCNAFFILFLFLYVLQFLLAPVLTSESFAALVVANALYSVAWGFYTYITFLGYMALPFLHRTERFLTPLGVIAAVFVATLLLQALFGVRVNFAHMSTRYYYSS